MDAVMDTPVVATVDAPRRRDEVLPEHEQEYPAINEVLLAIRERYDGTASCAHEIGLDFVNRSLLPYPGWRIEQIAREINVYEAKRDAIIQRVREEDAAGKSARSSTANLVTPPQRNRPTGKPVRDIDDAIAQVSRGEQTPMRKLLREDLEAIKNGPKCRECGKPFEPWKTGQGYNRKTCRDCFSAKMIAARAKRGSTPEPTAAPEPVYVAGPKFPTEILTAPGYAAPATPAASAEDAAIADNSALRQLLALLPARGRWSQRQRRRWLNAFEATLDLLIDDGGDERESEARS